VDQERQAGGEDDATALRQHGAQDGGATGTSGIGELQGGADFSDGIDRDTMGGPVSEESVGNRPSCDFGIVPRPPDGSVQFGLKFIY
jgi:hypothetical protein